MLYFLLILIILACVLLCLIILVQNPKGGGVSGAFGAQATQFLGARQATDFLEKATWYFGIGILVVVACTYFLTTSPNGESTQKAKVSTGTAADYVPSASPKGGAPGQQQGQPQQQGAPQQAPAPQPQQAPTPQPQQAPPSNK